MWVSSVYYQKFSVDIERSILPKLPSGYTERAEDLMR